MQYFKTAEQLEHVTSQLAKLSGEIFIITSERDSQKVLIDIYALLKSTPYRNQVVRHNQSIQVKNINGIQGMRIKTITPQAAETLQDIQVVTLL